MKNKTCSGHSKNIKLKKIRHLGEAGFQPKLALCCRWKQKRVFVLLFLGINVRVGQYHSGHS
jgi:hypothetical protein